MTEHRHNWVTYCTVCNTTLTECSSFTNHAHDREKRCSCGETKT